jgi:hypothetical protein
VFDKRGYEDRLARPRQAGDTETNMWARRQLDEGLRRGAGFEQEVGDQRQDKRAFQSISWRRGRRERVGKTGKPNEPGSVVRRGVFVMFEAKESFAGARVLAGGAAACNGRGSVRRILRDLPGDRGGADFILSRSTVMRRQAGKIHETVQPAATGGSLAQVAAREVDHCQARRREKAGHGAIPAAHEQTREFAKTRVMPDDQKGFYRGGRSGKKILQGVNAGVVERSFEFAGRFLRQFTQNHVERIARAPCRRNKGEIENESGCAKIGAHSRRVGAAMRRQPPFTVAPGCGSPGFSMANKDEPWHCER